MKKFFILFLFHLIFTNIFCQDFDGCVFIDFEELPNGETPTDNMILSDQFFADYGLTFNLSDGTLPHLAKTGSPVTAFGSSYFPYDDAPAPGEDVGSFFITDDGHLQGLESPDLIVNFTIPLDSFAAVVLDIDFGEVFTIESRDVFGEVIHTITIHDGDPNTGDGVATPFGFNSTVCEPPIYSIRFHGTREMAGAFGLGMDNFSFCTRDPDIRTLINIEATTPTCNTPTGTVTLTNHSGKNFTYSIDGSPFQSDSVFVGISPGIHQITFLDDFGCHTSVPVTVDNFVPLTISDLSVTHTSCGEDNGAVAVFASVTSGVFFSLDGGSYQEENIFTNLTPGNHTIKILDQDNCFDEQPFVIEDSEPPVIETIITKDDYCNDSTGNMTIKATGGTGQLYYAINDSLIGSDSFIPNLSAGEYSIKVTDAVGCEAFAQSTILPGTPIVMDDFQFNGPDCGAVNGSITFHASGGSGLINYWLNDSIVHPTGDFITLPGGIYHVSAIDANGCRLDSLAMLPIPQCPIYIPNGFTPNDDGINDNFQVFTNPYYDVDVLKFMIFNRWGGMVWIDEGFTINTYRKWWDGTFRGRPAQQGVYVYVIFVRHQNGFEEVLSGDVTLIR